MQPLFFLNKEIRNLPRVILFAEQRIMLLLAVCKLAHYGIKVDCIATIQGGCDDAAVFNIPCAGLDKLADSDHDSAVIVVGPNCESYAASIEQRGFHHVFCDYLSEMGNVCVRGDLANNDVLDWAH